MNLLADKAMLRSAVAGGVIWCGLLAAALANFAYITWLDLLFLFAPLVVVPLGLHLTSQVSTALHAPPPERWAGILLAPAALAATASFFFDRGTVAGALAAVWLAFCGLLGLSGLWRIFSSEFAQPGRIHLAVAFLYVCVGGAWMVASRLGLNPLGFQEPIVLLTAVHFHYAGFAAPLLARSTARSLRVKSFLGTILFRAVTVGVLAGPGVLACGFVLGPRVKLLAAFIVAASEVGLGVAFCFALPSIAYRPARLMLLLAVGSVFFSMILAATWAAGEYPLQPFLHLQQMERLHGSANAFGFVLCGMLGWILATSSESRDRETKP